MECFSKVLIWLTNLSVCYPDLERNKLPSLVILRKCSTEWRFLKSSKIISGFYGGKMETLTVKSESIEWPSTCLEQSHLLVVQTLPFLKQLMTMLESMILKSHQYWKRASMSTIFWNRHSTKQGQEKWCGKQKQIVMMEDSIWFSLDQLHVKSSTPFLRKIEWRELKLWIHQHQHFLLKECLVCHGV